MNEIEQLFHVLQTKNPLIHQITNTVTINDCANVTLSVGASPVMAPSPEEAAHMVRMADALVLNIGTLTNETFKGMIVAGKAANEKGIPVIFDPVGVGATPYRLEKTQSLFQQVDIVIIRGNASELDCLTGGVGRSKGVDAVDTGLNHQHLAQKAAELFNCVVVVSGKKDAISNGEKTYIINNGHHFLTKITGAGCMSTALIGSFAGATTNMLAAGIAGISIMGLAGELAGENLKDHEGLGTFKIKLLDAISNINGKAWSKGVKISEES